MYTTMHGGAAKACKFDFFSNCPSTAGPNVQSFDGDFLPLFFSPLPVPLFCSQCRFFPAWRQHYTVCICNGIKREVTSMRSNQGPHRSTSSQYASYSSSDRPSNHAMSSGSSVSWTSSCVRAQQLLFWSLRAYGFESLSRTSL